MTDNQDVQLFLKDLQKKRKHTEKQRNAKNAKDKHKKAKKNDIDKRCVIPVPCLKDPTPTEPPSSKEGAHRVEQTNKKTKKRVVPPHKYMLAPMVGASELPFRLLCRKYGAQTCYTPMMSAEKFASDPEYRAEYHLRATVLPSDHPVTCHVSANDPAHFAAAAVRAEKCGCDAIDLNLGCPQRTAFVGHYGSYLLDEPDLICDMIRAAVAATVSIPIGCKIRLLPTVPQTVDFCLRLCEAGVSVIAVHARHRASWERTAAGARDGPALLEHVAAIQQAVQQTKRAASVKIIANGNTITWEDVVNNLQSTAADGLMSAEGILDNPALFLPRYGSRQERDKEITVWTLRKTMDEKLQKKKRKLQKRLKEIQQLEERVAEGVALTVAEEETVATKESRLQKLQKLQQGMEQVTVTLGSLYDAADDKLKLAMEYVDLATAFPVHIRSVIFHVRRMLKDILVQYQLLEECLSSETIDKVRAILLKMEGYSVNPATFAYDSKRAKQEKDALERKTLEEGKRKAYEARMIRKAKREGKADLHHYLNIGAELPDAATLKQFKALPRDEVMAVWKEHHSQHCLSFHLDADGCKRGRACAFLHVDVAGSGKNAFVENDECAG